MKVMGRAFSGPFIWLILDSGPFEIVPIQRIDKDYIPPGYFVVQRLTVTLISIYIMAQCL